MWSRKLTGCQLSLLRGIKQNIILIKKQTKDKPKKSASRRYQLHEVILLKIA